jgi:hypothetical protein
MTQLNSLRKIIREEVRAVFQEELAGILKEAIIANRGGSTLTESPKPAKTQVPGTLNRAPKPLTAPMLGTGNPLNSILQETAAAMTPRDFESLGNGGGVVNDVPIVESVNGMFAAARPSSNLDAIEINAVPDFTALMSKMKANGEI